jgi:hypothetical protein
MVGIKVGLRKVLCAVGLIHLAQDREQWWAHVNIAMSLLVLWELGNFVMLYRRNSKDELVLVNAMKTYGVAEV